MRRACLPAAALFALLTLVPLRSGPGALAQAEPPAGEAPREEGAAEVDLELVLAVDISYSMDPEELVLQRMGYVEAFRSPEIVNAIRSGPTGRIAVTYVEWAGAYDQRIVAPWTLVDGEAAAGAFADGLAAVPTRRAYRTSISGAVDFAAPLFEDNAYAGIRRVIDVSGDGANNQGRPVTEARDAALARGITVNGLPLLLKRPGALDVDGLDAYYRECVIGGQGAFVVAVRERHQFAEAIRTKLLLEIANLQPAPRAMPAADERPADCLAGEKVWRERWERN